MVKQERVQELLSEVNGYIRLLFASPEEAYHKIIKAAKKWSPDEMTASLLEIKLRTYLEMHIEKQDHVGNSYCYALLKELSKSEEEFQLRGVFQLEEGVKAVDVVAGFKILMDAKLFNGNREEIANLISITTGVSYGTALTNLNQPDKTHLAEKRLRRTIAQPPKNSE